MKFLWGENMTITIKLEDFPENESKTKEYQMQFKNVIDDSIHYTNSLSEAYSGKYGIPKIFKHHIKIEFDVE